ncbi:MAG: methyltransferase domain-containing protein [Bryobacteraceae bacterium]|nr:methyltransferase domain-containing protein [Bryobacteraceae bacterium]
MYNPTDYSSALAKERQIYANCLDVHDLPASFHYWSNRYLVPKLLPHGFHSPDGLFLKVLQEKCEQIVAPRFLSLGAGNGDLECKLALELKALGHHTFCIECLDVNVEMLARGQRAARAHQLDHHLLFVLADFNTWIASGSYDAIIANQSLHHVSNLEGLFLQIRQALTPTGSFAISDMIGRNGHQRWPEALKMVQEFWRKLPPSYRVNRRLGGYEALFSDWDCSLEGFEGIRSQDILPLLIENFHFHLFVPFGNLIDPFVDRAFGGHFDMTAEWDRQFIDQVHARDEEEMASGNLTPTHLLAVVSQNSGSTPTDGEPPRAELLRAVRQQRASDAAVLAPGGELYDWSTWPHPAQKELAVVCDLLADSESGRLLRERTAWALSLQQELERVTKQALEWQGELERRTDWARSLERDLTGCTAWAEDLESQLTARTAWTLAMTQDLREHAEALRQLRLEFEERSTWAQQLDMELASRTTALEALQRELDVRALQTQDLERQLRRPWVRLARRATDFAESCNSIIRKSLRRFISPLP